MRVSRLVNLGIVRLTSAITRPCSNTQKNRHLQFALTRSAQSHCGSWFRVQCSISRVFGAATALAASMRDTWHRKSKSTGRAMSPTRDCDAAQPLNIPSLHVIFHFLVHLILQCWALDPHNLDQCERWFLLFGVWDSLYLRRMDPVFFRG